MEGGGEREREREEREREERGERVLVCMTCVSTYVYMY